MRIRKKAGQTNTSVLGKMWQVHVIRLALSVHTGDFEARADVFLAMAVLERAPIAGVLLGPTRSTGEKRRTAVIGRSFFPSCSW